MAHAANLKTYAKIARFASREADKGSRPANRLKAVENLDAKLAEDRKKRLEKLPKANDVNLGLIQASSRHTNSNAQSNRVSEFVKWQNSAPERSSKGIEHDHHHEDIEGAHILASLQHQPPPPPQPLTVAKACHVSQFG